MKTFLTAVLMFLSGVSFAASAGQIFPASPSSYSGLWVNESGLTYNQTYLLDMAQYQGSHLSFEVLASSQSYATTKIQDGAQSVGNIAISSYTMIRTSSMTVTIGGVVFKANLDFQAVTSNAQTATNLATAIAANTTLGLSAIGSASIVYTTSTLNGAVYNWTLASSSNTVGGALITSGAALTGGFTPDFTLGGTSFSTSPATGYPLGLPLLYAKNQTPAIGGLTGGTTYFYTPINATSWQLALYSTSAVAGTPASDFVVVASTNTGLTQNNYTLAPLGFAGSPAYIFQASNDGNFWTAASTAGASVAIPVPTGAGVTPLAPYDNNYDFQWATFRYYRLKVTAPTGSGLFMQVTPYIKQDGIGPY
jgi:hypothetical protein